MELFTRTAGGVADEVRAKFGDSTKVRLTDAMMLRWINAAFQEVSRQSPWLESTASCNIVAGTQNYAFSTYFSGLRIQRIDQVLVNGRKVEVVPFSELMERVANATLSEATGTPTAISLYGGSFTLWPTPNESIVDGLVIYFIAYPADIEALGATLLTVPDRFYNAVVDYVLRQAYEYDDNYETAEVKKQHFDEGMARELQRQAQSPSDFYPTIVDLDDDDFGPPSGPSVWRI